MAILLLSASFYFIEPHVAQTLTFAVTYFDNPASSTPVPQAPSSELQDQIAMHPEPLQRSHAPEPSSFFLLFGGIMGMVIRFARRSFDKFKRALDLYLSLLGLIASAPFLVLAAFLIKLTSSGPAIYTQNRVGRNGRIFRIYKLRTMRADAERGMGAVWASENDPRITPLGRILRKTHIDELPQLFNVLKGDMSIVGPRPERPEIVKDLRSAIVDYEKRLNVNPGITGLAQILHKYDETIADVKKKIKYDLLYIRKMCLWVEMRILAQTVVVALTGKGAR